ncbi:MAG: efflux RND transporter periplasmic adaptor subunit [Ignavibacteriaceae bacterium]
MKRLKIYSAAIIILIIIVAILFHNRAKIKAETKNQTMDSYPVNITTVTKKEITNHIDLVGNISAYNDVPIVSEAQGKVTKVLANVGDYKPAGSVLIQIDDELTDAALKVAKVNLEKAKKDYERFQELYKEKSATDSQLEGAKLAYQTADNQFVIVQKQYNDTKVSTPISGIVTSRTADFGDYVFSKTVVADVVDISRLKININVDEHDVFNLKVGDKVSVTTDIYPGITFPGVIKTISAKGDAAHTYPVEVDFSNSKEHPLKAGMFARVVFSSQTNGNTLVIPRTSLIGSVKQAQVFVVENGIARLKNIVIGETYNNYLEVLRGLNEGDTIVVNGQNNLQDGNKVNIVN